MNRWFIMLSLASRLGHAVLEATVLLCIDAYGYRKIGLWGLQSPLLWPRVEDPDTLYSQISIFKKDLLRYFTYLTLSWAYVFLFHPPITRILSSLTFLFFRWPFWTQTIFSSWRHGNLFGQRGNHYLLKSYALSLGKIYAIFILWFPWWENSGDTIGCDT